jgi:putative DNA primase/helicase
LQWQRGGGLRPPKVVTDATNEYLKAEDKLGRWADECLEPDSDGQITSTEMFHSWRRWALRNNEYVGSQTKFSIDLKEAGYTSIRKSEGVVFIGYKLKPFIDDVYYCNAPDHKCQRGAVCAYEGACQWKP